MLWISEFHGLTRFVKKKVIVNESILPMERHYQLFICLVSREKLTVRNQHNYWKEKAAEYQTGGRTWSPCKGWSFYERTFESLLITHIYTFAYTHMCFLFWRGPMQTSICLGIFQTCLIWLFENLHSKLVCLLVILPSTKIAGRVELHP